MSSFAENKEIEVAHLRVGMFVTQLETPWSATEFPLQGILVKSRQDIIKLSQYGGKVTIDKVRSSSHGIPPVKLPFVQKTRSLQKINIHKQIPRPWRKFCAQTYENNKSFSKEIVQAKKLLGRAEEIFADLKEELSSLDDRKIEQVIIIGNEIVESVLDNSDAILWLTKVKAKSGRVYDHTIRVSMWAILMARSMGLSKASIYMLNQAILLSGIGKAHLSKNAWRRYNSVNIKPEFAVCSNITISKLMHCKNITPQIFTIISNMNERFDGTGLPNKKSAAQIPYLSQIAGLVESFDLIMHPMFSSKTHTFAKALSKLYCLSDSLFDGALIEEFIQAAGLYPVGTQVLLSNGYSGVVLEQSKSRRIRATVTLTHDSEGYRLIEYQIVNLGDGEYKDVIVQAEQQQYELLADDIQRINQLIRKNKLNKITLIKDWITSTLLKKISLKERNT